MAAMMLGWQRAMIIPKMAHASSLEKVRAKWLVDRAVELPAIAYVSSPIMSTAFAGATLGSSAMLGFFYAEKWAAEAAEAAEADVSDVDFSEARYGGVYSKAAA